MPSSQLRSDSVQENLPTVIIPTQSLGSNEDASLLYMDLHSEAYSDAGKWMIMALASDIHDGFGISRKPTKKLQIALGALVADLLKGLSYSPPTPCHRHMRRESFTGCSVGYKVFVRLVDFLKRTGFIEVTTGKWFRYSTDGEGRLTVFKATPNLVRYALAHGITPANYTEHFKRLPRPKAIADPIKLSRQRLTIRGVKKPKSVMAVNRKDPKIKALADQVNRLNAYFAMQDITPDRHYAFQRQFHDGDVDGFDWNMGGRLYSVGCDCYQQMPTKDRDDDLILRRELRINGMATVEIDIGSSHLRILHALADKPIEQTVDPYLLSKFPREVVKDFVTMTLGYTSFQRAWSPRKKEEYQERGIDLQKAYPIAYVRKAVLCPSSEHLAQVTA